MDRPELPPELQMSCHCPACAEPLATAHSVDPWVLCLSCPSGHRFFIEPTVSARASATAASAHFPELDNAEVGMVAAFWLTDARARSVLNQQVAQMLRAIVEERAPEHTPTTSYCPICAAALLEGGISIVERIGLACSARHEWVRLMHGLSAVSAQQSFVLYPEMSRQAMINLVHAWLEGTGELPFSGNLPDSVRAVLLASEFAKAPVIRPSP